MFRLHQQQEIASCVVNQAPKTNELFNIMRFCLDFANFFSRQSGSSVIRLRPNGIVGSASRYIFPAKPNFNSRKFHFLHQISLELWKHFSVEIYDFFSKAFGEISSFSSCGRNLLLEMFRAAELNTTLMTCSRLKNFWKLQEETARKFVRGEFFVFKYFVETVELKLNSMGS